MADSDRKNEMLTGENSVVSKTDGSLLRRFQEGQQDAATALYIRYARRLQALAKKQTGQKLSPRFDPEDVVQSVFRTFFRRASEGCYEVPVGEELWQLLLVLALNKIRTLAVYHRAKKRDAGRTVGTERVAEVATEVSGEDAVAYETMRMMIDELVAKLPSPQGRIVQLRIEGHEISEIAQLTDRSKRTVERILHRFRQQLTELIDEDS
jgi:RNA polymerase sigma-70 factor (ECF subfamily)